MRLFFGRHKTIHSLSLDVTIFSLWATKGVADGQIDKSLSTR